MYTRLSGPRTVPSSVRPRRMSVRATGKTRPDSRRWPVSTTRLQTTRRARCRTGVEPGPQCPEGSVIRRSREPGEAERCPQKLAALVEHGLFVGSRTGAVPAWVRLQPPPHRTAQTDSPYAALLSASRHGLCDLSTRSAFGRGPVADPVVSEEPEPVMEPCRTGPPLREKYDRPRQAIFMVNEGVESMSTNPT